MSLIEYGTAEYWQDNHLNELVENFINQIK